jgi:hypothetical protein
MPSKRTFERLQTMLRLLAEMLAELKTHDAAQPPPPAREPLAPNHRAHIRPDCSMCCSRHEAQFEASIRRHRDPVMIPAREWLSRR